MFGNYYCSKILTTPTRRAPTVLFTLLLLSNRVVGCRVLLIVINASGGTRSERSRVARPKWCPLIKFRALSMCARDSVTVSACFPVIPAAWITARPRIKRWILSFARTHPTCDYHRDTFTRQDSNEHLAW